MAKQITKNDVLIYLMRTHEVLRDDADALCKLMREFSRDETRYYTGSVDEIVAQRDSVMGGVFDLVRRLGPETVEIEEKG